MMLAGAVVGRGRENRESQGLAQGFCEKALSVPVDVAVVGIRARAKTSLSLKIGSLHVILTLPDEKRFDVDRSSSQFHHEPVSKHLLFAVSSI